MPQQYRSTSSEPDFLHPSVQRSFAAGFASHWFARIAGSSQAALGRTTTSRASIPACVMSCLRSTISTNPQAQWTLIPQLPTAGSKSQLRTATRAASMPWPSDISMIRPEGTTAPQDSCGWKRPPTREILNPRSCWVTCSSPINRIGLLQSSGIAKQRWQAAQSPSIVCSMIFRRMQTPPRSTCYFHFGAIWHSPEIVSHVSELTAFFWVGTVLSSCLNSRIHQRSPVVQQLRISPLAC